MGVRKRGEGTRKEEGGNERERSKKGGVSTSTLTDANNKRDGEGGKSSILLLSVFSALLAAALAGVCFYAATLLLSSPSPPLTQRGRGREGNFTRTACSESSVHTYEREREEGDITLCTPHRCGRTYVNDFLSEEEVDFLVEDIYKKALSKVGSKGGSGPVTLVEITRGAVSKEKVFTSLYRTKGGVNEKFRHVFGQSAYAKFEAISNKTRAYVCDVFGIHPCHIYLSSPVFISNMVHSPALTMNDEYWHEHVDIDQYENFVYTGLVYLRDFGKDFDGGRFIFDNDGHAIEPKRGSFLAFTSGREHPHHVEKVTRGERMALTISFTCSKKLDKTTALFHFE
eukprot:CAMPEP_0113906806 /NCGR_PEP_ID=MMETSP0780_2-20120614/25023_1 /TAXON_ID=652834 /ORGANISM="Palpitomonas bilix" /LENGTH=340 /DNA_ID=CAMNT_0000901589 /DNA_START=287 /DNA_END=1309 /DNA_ORIENTATION=+ /assembly_acc=CAM_ASM_000599